MAMWLASPPTAPAMTSPAPWPPEAPRDGWWWWALRRARAPLPALAREPLEGDEAAETEAEVEVEVTADEAREEEAEEPSSMSSEATAPPRSSAALACGEEGGDERGWM